MPNQGSTPKPKSKASSPIFPNTSKALPPLPLACVSAKYKASEGLMFTVMQSRCMPRTLGTAKTKLSS